MSQDEALHNLTRAQEEFRRIESIRQDLGDEAWARELGTTMVTYLVLLLEPSAHMRERAELVFQALAPQFQLLHEHPVLGKGAAVGMIEDLACRNIIPLNYQDLIRSRHQRQKHR